VFRSVFSRLLTVFMAVILVCVSLLLVIFYLSMRDSRINDRMDALKTQAYDMAYLASRMEYDIVERSLGYVSPSERYMEWKVQRVIDEFNAYSIIVDRTGQVVSYIPQSLRGDEDIRDTLDMAKLNTLLSAVIKGEEIVLQTTGTKGPMFTVAVPWISNGMTMGAVLIQTAAQTVRASYEGLALQVALAAIGMLIIAAGCVFLFTRQITKPLTAMSQAAGSMAKGDFEWRIPEKGSREIRDLAAAFNGMSAQLQVLEQTRRDFVANVSHEMRSPITNIQGFIQGMIDGTIPEGEHGRYMQTVVDETRRLTKLITGLLNLSRLENSDTPPALADFDVNELARRVIVNQMAQIDEKELEVELKFENEACVVRADPDQIEQVIINLAENAIKFTPQGGKIIIATRETEKQVSLIVSDNGTGISKQDAPFIFDRFYKSDKAHTAGKGTGLGLSICRKIMEKHGQTIRLLSGENGASFEITLASGRKAVASNGD
jgi:signal transduction histidine kinase